MVICLIATAHDAERAITCFDKAKIEAWNAGGSRCLFHDADFGVTNPRDLWRTGTATKTDRISPFDQAGIGGTHRQRAATDWEHKRAT